MNNLNIAFNKIKEIIANKPEIKLINSPFSNYYIKVNNFDLNMNLAYVDIVVKKYNTLTYIDNICVTIVDNENLKLNKKEVTILKQREKTSIYKFSTDSLKQNKPVVSV